MADFLRAAEKDAQREAKAAQSAAEAADEELKKIAKNCIVTITQLLDFLHQKVFGIVISFLGSDSLLALDSALTVHSMCPNWLNRLQLSETPALDALTHGVKYLHWLLSRSIRLKKLINS